LSILHFRLAVCQDLSSLATGYNIACGQPLNNGGQVNQLLLDVQEMILGSGDPPQKFFFVVTGHEKTS
jgi:hypothetical protein